MRIEELMTKNPASGRAAAFVQYTMFIVIMAAAARRVRIVTCAICETIPEMEHEYIFHILEPVFTAVFTLEISTRWWVADSNWDFFASPFSIIDMLATLPGYVDIVLPLILDADNEMAQAEKHKRIISMNSLRAIRLADLMRIVRLLRVLRVANTMRQWEMINVVLKSIYGSLQGILVLISFTTVGTILSSTVAYVFEMGDDTKFTSIPASMWWAASTITAVGYGDLVPRTVAGKLTAVTTMLFGF
ncbi:KCNB2, partial [Symbiodinium microadriaticum]